MFRCWAALVLTAYVARVAAADGPVLPSDLLTRVLYDEPHDQLERLAKISDAGPNILSRTFMSPAHKKASSQIAAWMRRAGLRTWWDNVGNVHGRIEGRNKRAPAVVLGSHYDTVYDAGKYDGTLGIITAIAAVKAMVLEAAVASGVVTAAEALPTGAAAYVNLEELLDDKIGRLLDAPVEVIAFSDEEGVRFQTTFLGSSAVAGTLVSTGGLAAVDSSGQTVESVLEANNFPGTAESVEDAAMRADRVAEYVEMHIEQGPILESLDRPLGLVEGGQGHAGTVPMKLRKDPLAGAVQIMHEIETTCVGKTPDVTTDDSLVCTVGMVQIWPGASNVIPGVVNFTVDMRSRSNEVRIGLSDWVYKRVHEVCDERGLSCHMQKPHEASTVHCDSEVTSRLKAAIRKAEKLGGEMRKFKDCLDGGEPEALCSYKVPLAVPLPRSTPDSADGDDGGTCGEGAQAGSCAAAAGGDGAGGAADVPVLVSGAGHDAMAMATLTKVGMLFVRCEGGISHSPFEKVEQHDIGTATAALYFYLRDRVAWQPE